MRRRRESRRMWTISEHPRVTVFSILLARVNLILLENPRESKVSEFDVVVTVEEDVLAFDVTVNDGLLLEILREM